MASGAFWSQRWPLGGDSGGLGGSWLATRSPSGTLFRDLMNRGKKTTLIWTGEVSGNIETWFYRVRHWKETCRLIGWFVVDVTHLLPATDPSFLPVASSNSTPAHSPEAKSVAPRYLNVPVFTELALVTWTRSPTFSLAPASPPDNDDGVELRVIRTGVQQGRGDADRTLPLAVRAS